MHDIAGNFIFLIVLVCSTFDLLSDISILQYKLMFVMIKNIA